MPGNANFKQDTKQKRMSMRLRRLQVHWQNVDSEAKMGNKKYIENIKFKIFRKP